MLSWRMDPVELGPGSKGGLSPIASLTVAPPHLTPYAGLPSAEDGQSSKLSKPVSSGKGEPDETKEHGRAWRGGWGGLKAAVLTFFPNVCRRPRVLTCAYAGTG